VRKESGQNAGIHQLTVLKKLFKLCASRFHYQRQLRLAQVMQSFFGGHVKQLSGFIRTQKMKLHTLPERVEV
jgi:hypothetical protein